MRKTAIAAMAGAALAITPVLAQTRTTDDFVCELAPENCAEVEVPADQAPQPATRGEGRTSSTRGFTLARPKGQASASGSGASTQTTVTKLKPVPAGQQANARPGASVTGQRVDLRLAFDTGSAMLTPVARAEAKVFADSLMRPELKGLKFMIEGHTDSVGGRDYNLDLSRRRAQAVADFLVTQGVSRDRLDVRGVGYDKPLPGMSAGAAENRRVEAVRLS